LYRPDDRSVNDWLNQRLRRTEFMPFAPSTRAEEARQCYEEMDGAEEAARFMTICLPCTPRMVERCAGVVHVDGTARPQIVRPEENPEYYSILSAFARRTGVGTVINTSFNMHEEPIVATAADAVKGWRDANLDALVLGPFLVLRDQNGTGNVGSERAE
jgi:carbamoyltransferase